MRLWPLLFLVIPFACSPEPDLRVSAASSLFDAMEEIGEAYSRGSGRRVAFNFGASATLGQQIARGAPADVVIVADERTIDDLEKRQRIVPGSRRRILGNRLVVIAPRESHLVVQRARDLLGVRRIALGDPATVAAGNYAEEYLRNEGVWDELRRQRRLVPVESVRAALAAVESGNADAAIVFLTDARSSSRVRTLVVVDGPTAPSVGYFVARMTAGANGSVAEDFLRFIDGKAAREIFVQHGFEVVESR